MDKTLEQMQAEVRDVNILKGWRQGSNSFGDYIALLHSELSEALEAYRDHRLADATRLDLIGDIARPPKPEGVGSEFADVLIRLLDVCDIYGVSLRWEFERKIAYNRTRPYQHGGRTLAEDSRALCCSVKRERGNYCDLPAMSAEHIAGTSFYDHDFRPDTDRP